MAFQCVDRFWHVIMTDRFYWQHVKYLIIHFKNSYRFSSQTKGGIWQLRHLTSAQNGNHDILCLLHFATPKPPAPPPTTTEIRQRYCNYYAIHNAPRLLCVAGQQPASTSLCLVLPSTVQLAHFSNTAILLSLPEAIWKRRVYITGSIIKEQTWHRWLKRKKKPFS